MSLNVTVQDAGVAAMLRQMSARLRDMTPVYKAIGGKLERNVELRFDLKEDPDGSPWKAWAPSTAAARAREGRGTLLEYTGRMRASLTHVADDKSVEVGFGVPYAEHVERERHMLFSKQGGLGAGDLQDVMDTARREFARQLQLQP